ncbi:putative multidrug ABC transporter ATP-binding protein YbhF [Clostridiales bacterium]|nr:putative multidrug ABC transporter ATP-binding protein YbhF [Clostridiales bacterium]
MNKIIEIRNLNKSFGNIKAVNDLSFDVAEGELFAFLGVNGAGKSTTINIICGQLSYDSGSVIIDADNLNSNSQSIKNALGIVFQNSVLDKALTVYDNLENRAALYGIYGNKFKARLNELSELLDFKDLLKRTVGKLSGGQLRRIDIARALLHNPKILILDEPTTGLDPQTRKTLWNVISILRKEKNMTVFLTTHYMEEAAEADYVVIIDSGKITAKGTPLELKNTYTGDFITLYGAKDSEIELLNCSYEKIHDTVYRVSVENTEAATKLILKYPEIFRDYEITKGKMDDVFLAVTGKKLSGGET